MITVAAILNLLPPRDGETVRTHVEAEAQALRDAVERAGIEDEICALGVMWVEGSSENIDSVDVLTIPVRAAMLEQPNDEGLWDLWSPVDWPLTVDLVLDAGYRRRRRSAGTARRLLRTAAPHDSNRLLHELIASNIGLHPPEGLVSDDFLMFVTEHEVTDNDLERVATYAPFEATQSLVRRDLLKLPEPYDV